SMPPDPSEDRLLTPREVAARFGVGTTTIGRWTRAGELPAQRTPGGQRRYRAADVRALLDAKVDPDKEQLELDAVRLYDQGWSIRQVADKFDYSYGAMRRILHKRTTLRPR
ncbi:MAG: helix-turn-helix domain-containing protein, partial [Actinoallomurus sp.]